jgi:hypothetical protein
LAAAQGRTCRRATFQGFGHRKNLCDALPPSVAFGGMGIDSDVLKKFKTAIETPEPPMLGPQGRAGTLSIPELEQKLGTFFPTAEIRSSAQPLLRSAALLWHDHLDASHTISQAIETRDGSWLHGIMHRREPDYGNAKYWFRRVGEHPAFAALAQQVAALLHNDSGGLTARLIENGEWQSFAFIDECEQAESSKDATLIARLRDVQAAEFDVLVAHILSS